MKNQTKSTPNQNPQSTPAGASPEPSDTTPREARPSESLNCRPHPVRPSPALESQPSTREASASGGLNSPPLHPRRLRRHPEEFTEELADAIYDEIRFYGHTDVAAAAKHGVSATSIAQWKYDQVDFATDLEAARAEFKERMVEEIRNAAKRDGTIDWRARAWLLERIYPNEFARGKRRKPREPEIEKELDPNDPFILTPERLEHLRQRREAALRADADAGQSDAEMRAYALFYEWKRGYLAHLAAGGPVDPQAPEWVEQNPDLWWLHPRHPAPILESAAVENAILYPEHVRSEWEGADNLAPSESSAAQ